MCIANWPRVYRAYHACLISRFIGIHERDTLPIGRLYHPWFDIAAAVHTLPYFIDLHGLTSTITSLQTHSALLIVFSLYIIFFTFEPRITPSSVWECVDCSCSVVGLVVRVWCWALIQLILSYFVFTATLSVTIITITINVRTAHRTSNQSQCESVIAALVDGVASERVNCPIFWYNFGFPSWFFVL